MKSRAQKMREIEKEFDEPFWDVVRGFAEMGYSRRGTAKIIGYNERSFCDLVKHRPDIEWVSISEAMKGHFTLSAEHKKRLNDGNIKRARKYYCLNRWLTVAEIAQIAGIKKDGVRSRLSRGVSGDRLADKPMPRSERGRIGAQIVNSLRKRREAA